VAVFLSERDDSINNCVKVLFTFSSDDSSEMETEKPLGYSLRWGLLQPSGHSTVRILFANPDDIEPTREYLRKNGCDSEISDLPRLVSVDIPPVVEYYNQANP
jgi:hypothetical protein